MSGTRNALLALVILAAAWWLPGGDSSVRGDIIPVNEFAGTNGEIDVTSAVTMELRLGDLLLGGGSSGLTIDPFDVDVTSFTANPGDIELSDIVISGFDGGATVTLATSNERLETLPPFYGIGIGAITLSLSPVGGSAVKGGDTYVFGVSEMAITYQGPVVTDSPGGGSVAAGPIASASLTAVPEPSSLLLVALGLPGLALYARHRRRR